MGRTPQRQPGPAFEEDSIQFEDRVSDPEVVGSLWRRGNELWGHDGLGKYNLRPGASGQLDFLLDCDPNSEDINYAVTYTGSVVTGETWVRAATGKTIKTSSYAYSGSRVQNIVTRVYDTDGTTILAQMTEVFTYTGGRVTSSTLTRDV